MTDLFHKTVLEFWKKYRRGIAQNGLNLEVKCSGVPRVRDLPYGLIFLLGNYLYLPHRDTVTLHMSDTFQMFEWSSFR